MSTWGSGPMKARALLAAVIPEGTCQTCLEREDSALHRELCTITPQQPQQSQPGRNQP